MDRFEFTRNAVMAFRPECTALLMGKIDVNNVPKEGIAGLLYFFLNLQIDCLRMRWSIEEESDEIQEIYEDYLFDLNLGMSWVLNKSEEADEAVIPISGAKLHLDMAADVMDTWCNHLNHLISGLMCRLLDFPNAVSFFGTEAAASKVKAFVEADVLVEKLSTLILDGFEYAVEGQVDRVQLLLDVLAEG